MVITKSKIYLLFLIFTNVVMSDSYINIDISKQRLFVMKNDQIVSSYPISSSKYGEGSKQNSFKTPLGHHKIKEMIGSNAKINTIFKSRIKTNKQAKIEQNPIFTNDDYITSRIIWLDGQESGINKGSGVDSFSRYIYIHGTHEEGMIGSKASHGCIRMFNNDVIELYDTVKIGTDVYISS